MQRLLSILALIVLLAVPGMAGAQQVELGRYYALVVGINDYRKMPKLQSAVNDASAVHDLLRREYGFTSELLLNAKRADIISALDRYRRQLKPGDNFLFYYAGHGQLDADADAGYWLPADADPDSQVNWIALQSLTSTLRALPAKHVMVVSDSCFSGMLARGPLTASLGAGERSADIARLAAKRARTVLASGGLEPVMDAGGDGHSVFTRAFLQVLREANEPIIGHELYNQLRPRVIVNSPQTPEYADIRMAGHDGGDFVFMPYNKVRAPAPAATAAAPPARPAQDMAASYELAFWDAIKDSSRPEDYRAYLEAYPNGRFAPLARVRAGQTIAAAPPRTAPAETAPRAP
ncbi:MAG: caspase family protein, partial [Alphaproteobacteria bacterium]|nr:caspase family protein [Alphaproteobacteria bacterium]